MSRPRLFQNARIIYPHKTEIGSLAVVDGKIVSSLANVSDVELVDLQGQYLSPGFVELHVHGGGGSDFMDLTPEAFQTTCRTHLRHGTTSMTPTSTVASPEDYDRFLDLCRQFRGQDTTGSRIVGAHLYGPYFVRHARGCHPDATFMIPESQHADHVRGFDAGFPLTVTVAPETLGTEAYVREARKRGISVNIGHSHATFEQVEAAVSWGAGHVDHLFCAMSDRARLRQTQTFPMRGGVMEATLYFDELTTEVIADGQHLNDSLLRLAFKVKGPDRLALVSDTMRAVDMPDGEYIFGPKDSGERIRRLGNVGVTMDGTALASGVMGLDHCVRTMHHATKAPLHEIIRMASLTPARILGLDSQIGSLEPGKIADLLVLNDQLEIQQVFQAGKRIAI